MHDDWGDRDKKCGAAKLRTQFAILSHSYSYKSQVAARMALARITLVWRKGMSPIRVPIEATLLNSDFRAEEPLGPARLNVPIPKMLRRANTANSLVLVAAWPGAHNMRSTQIGNEGGRAVIGTTRMGKRLVPQPTPTRSGTHK